MIPLGAMLGVGATAGLFSSSNPVYQALPLITAVLGVLILSSFFLTRLAKRLL